MKEHEIPDEQSDADPDPKRGPRVADEADDERQNRGQQKRSPQPKPSD